jgi:hypothetical protein
MSKLSTSPHLIEDENFMMNIFSEYLGEIVPFREYWEVTFEKKQMSVVACCGKDEKKGFIWQGCGWTCSLQYH